MLDARDAYRIATKVMRESEDWKYLEERIEYHANRGDVQMFVSFDHNPQSVMHMMRELGYTVAVEKVDTKARYYSFIISWFQVTQG